MPRFINVDLGGSLSSPMILPAPLYKVRSSLPFSFLLSFGRSYHVKSPNAYTMSYEHPHGTEMHDRTFAKRSSTSGPLESQALDLDARTLALLGKKQRLKVASNCAMSPLAHLIITF